MKIKKKKLGTLNKNKNKKMTNFHKAVSASKNLRLEWYYKSV
jgi:hypothetical protein